MAKSLNSVQLLGRLGKDPELSTTQSGTSFSKFSMATTQSYKDRNDQWQEKVDWHDCIAWGRRAEIIYEYVRKGDQLFIAGRLETNSWEDHNSGEKRYRTQVVVEDVILLGGKKEERQQQQASQSAQQTQSAPFDAEEPPF